MMDTRKIDVGTLEAALARRPSAVLISEVLLGELPEGIGYRRPALQGGSRITYRVSSEAFADGIHRTIRRPSGDPLPRSWPPLLVGEPQGEFELQRLLRMDMRSTRLNVRSLAGFLPSADCAPAERARCSVRISR